MHPAGFIHPEVKVFSADQLSIVDLIPFLQYPITNQITVTRDVKGGHQDWHAGLQILTCTAKQFLRYLTAK
jgi:hypothetical protein